MEIPQPINEEIMHAALARIRTTHPRVIATPARVAAVRSAAADSPTGRLADALVVEAKGVLDLAPLVYEKEGRRLLHISREALRRFTLLGIAWFRTGDVRFVRRAEADLAAVCAFADWNPSHYLDVAEMALAVALGYDWFYTELSAEMRATARDGLVRHAFATAFPDKGKSWDVARNNWGQVCHGGLAAAALALFDDIPESATRILQRSVNNVQLATTCYAPDGVYPEGPSYWDYGTSYQIVLVESLRSALGTDFGLTAMPGFLDSAAAVLHHTGPTGQLYGFADGGSPRRNLPLLLWFDAEGAVSLPAQAPERRLAEEHVRAKDRLAPLAVFWIDRLSAPAAATTLPRDLCGGGSQPVLAMRSAWDDPQAWYLGVKGGSPQGPHGHMDGGSFILEARGVRWVLDLGAENYHKIESLGMGLWDKHQESDRWRVFKLSTAAHSVIRINDAQQQVNGNAELLECVTEDEAPFSRWDLTSLYPIAQRAERRFDFPRRAALHVTDCIDGLAAGSRVTWSFPTAAEVALDPNDPATLILRQEGRELRLMRSGDDVGPWRVTDADTLLHSYDTPLPGIRIVSFEATAPASGSLTFAVRFE